MGSAREETSMLVDVHEILSTFLLTNHPLISVDRVGLGTGQQLVAGSNIVWCMNCAGRLIVGCGGPDENIYVEVD